MHLHNILIKPSSALCNMKCDYCFYCDEALKRETADYGFMSEETLKAAIKKVLLNASQDVCFAFQGGEPTLRGISFYRKAVELEQRYNKNKVRITNTIQTNGIVIDEEWCQMFREHHFLVGISLDGTQKTHDSFRHTREGLPTYDRVMESIRLLEKYKIDYNILTVVTGRTASDIAEIYREYRKNGWNYQQYIACLEPLGEPGGKAAYSLTPKAYGEFLTTLFRLWYKDWKKGKAPYIRQFENYIGIIMGYPPEACGQSGRCSIQGVVEADGSVYPCDFYVLDEYRLGNIHTDKIPDFSEQEIARKFIGESECISSECKTCEYYLLCRGGCKRYRIKAGDGYKEYYCESYRKFFKIAYPKMKEIAEYIEYQKRQSNTMQKKNRGF